MPDIETLAQLRRARELSKKTIASTLRLSVDVWHKLENGAILLETLSSDCLNTLAQGLQITREELLRLLTHKHASTQNSMCYTTRRPVLLPEPQSFATAITRSSMSREDKQYWLQLTGVTVLQNDDNWYHHSS
jgi:hypothetical protein